MNTDKKIKQVMIGICSKCNQEKELVRKYICQKCKNDREQERRRNLSDEKKEEMRLKERQRYEKKKTNIVDVVVDEKKTKVCTVCNQEKSLSEFYVAKCKGKIRAECKECASKWRKDNYQKNKKAVNTQVTKYQIAKMKVDPIFKITRYMRSRISSAFRSQDKKKSERTMKYVDCTKSFLKEWLESQFTEEMTHENYGSYWHIDHVKPCSSFDLSKEDEIAECFNGRNLQPLKGEENLSKSNKICQTTIEEHRKKSEKFLMEMEDKNGRENTLKEEC
jgi:hypothetical protein